MVGGDGRQYRYIYLPVCHDAADAYGRMRTVRESPVTTKLHVVYRVQTTVTAVTAAPRSQFFSSRYCRRNRRVFCESSSLWIYYHLTLWDNASLMHRTGDRRVACSNPGQYTTTYRLTAMGELFTHLGPYEDAILWLRSTARPTHEIIEGFQQQKSNPKCDKYRQRLYIHWICSFYVFLFLCSLCVVCVFYLMCLCFLDFYCCLVRMKKWWWWRWLLHSIH